MRAIRKGAKTAWRKEVGGWARLTPLGILHHVRIPQLEEQISELLQNTSRQRKGLFSPPKASINIQWGN